MHYCVTGFQVDTDVVIGSIWREKFEEMVDENAELQVKLSSVESQMSCLLNKMQRSVAELSSEVIGLKYCIDDNISNLAGDTLSMNKNSSASDTIS